MEVDSPRSSEQWSQDWALRETHHWGLIASQVSGGGPPEDSNCESLRWAHLVWSAFPAFTSGSLDAQLSLGLDMRRGFPGPCLDL